MTDNHGESLESTATLLQRIRQGDAAARERLVRRYLPALRRWAHGRLPARARNLADTDDIVQVTLLRALDRVKEFESRKEGAFMAYLRRILQNQVRDQIRRVARSPGFDSLPDALPELGPTPLEQAVGRQTLASYEAALARLSEQQQEAVVLKIELGFTHGELAAALGSPSPNAARMVVVRALARLAEVMDER